MERCPSGRRSATGNRVGGQKPSRGFKSLSLRHHWARATGLWASTLLFLNLLTENVAGAMRVTVNGVARDLPDGVTVLQMLEAMNLLPERVAVERNLAIVDRTQFGVLRLQSGDRIEIISFVGGGR